MLKRLLHLPLHWQILIALIAAVAAGLATGGLSGEPVDWALNAYRMLGTLFLNALRMITVPLVVTAVISGIAQIGGGRDFGRLGAKTLGFYMLTTTLAVLTGLLVVQLIQPGLVNGQPARDLIGLSADTAEVQQKVAGRTGQDFADVLLRMVPSNPIAAAAEGDMLGLIVFSLLFGFFLSRLPGGSGGTLTGLIQSTFDVMMRLTDWILRFAPLGVFGLVARVVATTGLDAWRPLAAFFSTVVLALGAHMFITMPLLLILLARVKPWRHFRAMAPALLTAFSTSSSTATVPVSLDCLEKRAGVSNRVGSFVVPLGATVNMDGTALYECVAALFIAQAYGLELTFTTQFTVVALAILTSIGVAGIPAASLVAIVLILQNIGLPAEGIGLILATDRILDMCRTTVNIFGDATGAVVIAKSEGESNVLATP
ncbi:MAG TPA: dicarboxylate/amino acid:cation symporter [Kiritimatiellia bacterium]|nr:dicarboxylate/amino acid:cation symporter [Kiritimatiellia bacterium]